MLTVSVMTPKAGLCHLAEGGKVSSRNRFYLSQSLVEAGGLDVLIEQSG